MTSDSLNTVIKALDQANALPYVVFVGSWAQYIYSQTIFPKYRPSVKTRDIDIMYVDLKIPTTDLPVVECLVENGFRYAEDPYSGVAKFYGDEESEVEFLTRSIPSKERSIYTIKQFGIKSEGLRDMNILTEHTSKVMFMGKVINVPEPSAYILQKLLGLQNRKPESKREKDVSSAESLLQYISNDPAQLDRLYNIYSTLTKHEKEQINWAINTYGDRYDLSLLRSDDIGVKLNLNEPKSYFTQNVANVIAEEEKQNCSTPYAEHRNSFSEKMAQAEHLSSENLARSNSHDDISSDYEDR